MARKPVVRFKPGMATGPKLDKPGNSNTPKKPSVIMEDAKPSDGRFTKAGKQGPFPKPQAPKATPKSPSVTFEKPQPSTRFADAAKKGAELRAAGGAGESTLAKGARFGLKTVGKALSRANIVVDMIANAQPAGLGSDKPSGPLMKGNSQLGSLRKQGAGTYTKSYDSQAKRPAAGTYTSPYDVSPKPTSSSSGSMGMSFNGASATGAKSVGMSFNGINGSMPASSTSDAKFSKGGVDAHIGSSEYRKAPGATQTKRGAVVSTSAPVQTGKPSSRMQSRYQRDSGLAMDSRKRK